MAWRANPGHLPDGLDIIDSETGERKSWRAIHVRLRNGWTSELTGPWPAAGRQPATRWTLQSHPFDIIEFTPA